MIKTSVFAALLSIISTNLLADWQLNNHGSTVNFVSVKATNVMEVHQFQNITGQLSREGQFSLTIDLSSIDSKIKIRDERMRKYLFAVDSFASATVSAKIDAATLQQLSTNSTTSMSLTAELNLHGKQKAIPLTVSITKLGNDNLIVASRQPVIINGDDFELITGIEKLRELAGLSSISTSVPVSFILELNQ